MQRSLRFLPFLASLALASFACLPWPPSLAQQPPAKQDNARSDAGSPPHELADVATAAQVNALTTSFNAFAFDLYAQLRRGDGNLFFSPYSISTGLAMTSAGARWETLEEMSRVLHLPPQAELHPAAAAMTDDMLRRAVGDVDLAMANTLWPQAGKVLRDDFLALTRGHYRAGCQPLDFSGDPESARLTINDWTEKQTRQRIRDLLPRGLLTRDTRLVLTNAIYFKARWDREFDKTATRDEDFNLLNGGTVKKPMMQQAGHFPYSETADLQVLSMPYAGNDFDLVIFLPRRGSSLSALESAMAKELSNWLATLFPRQVIVTVPKFEMAMALSMKDVLAQMGMAHAFSPHADFSGIDNGQDPLYIADVIHKAYVEVSEKGTEAAAATAVIAMPGAAAPLGIPEPTPEFTADRPFVYLIRNSHTGGILFLGRYVGK